MLARCRLYAAYFQQHSRRMPVIAVSSLLEPCLLSMRRSSPQTAVPTRLAEVGSQYFDPFTGLPMLWSPTQQKLYSVGRDRLDDGGDPTFDISVPAVVGQAVVGPTQAKSTGPAAPRSSRR